jgi:3-deoxy-D-manno-octulosonic-acid transferase
MEGEEEAVLTALERAGGGERALLILAPRHPERWDAVAALLEARGVPSVRRSTLDLVGPEAVVEGRPAVLLLDSLGELAAVYRGALGAFVGGTLVPKGGHNPLEPGRLGVPIAVGPSMENFREIAAAFDGATAWARVGSGEELGELWRRWLDEPEGARLLGERAGALVEANRGATAKTLALLAPLLATLPGVHPGGGAP